MIAQRIIASLEPCAFDDEIAQLKTKLIVDSVGKTSKLKIMDCFTSGPTQHRRRTWIGVTSQIMQQVKDLHISSLCSPYPSYFRARSDARCRRSEDVIAFFTMPRSFISRILASIATPVFFSEVVRCEFLRSRHPSPSICPRFPS